MTLGYSVDRADFDALVAEAQRRIIPRTRGEWTLHGQVDPGITLVELYAWLLDQRAYLADQVSDPLARALLALLGERMRPATAAATVLAIEPEVAAVVPRRAALRPVRGGLALTFTTREPVAVAPLAEGGPGAPAIELHTFEAARAELRRGAALLPAHGRPASAAIVLRFREPLPVGEWTGLLIDLEGRVAPEWSPDAATVEPPATLELRRRGPSGDEPIPAADLRDGTGGLRRSGILRLRVAPGWARPGPGGCTEYELAIATAAATFTAPPRVRQIVPNAVGAANRHWRSEELPAGSLAPISGQTLQLSLDEGAPFEDRAWLCLDEVDGRAHRWRPTAAIDRHGPGARAFEVDRARGVIRFGDGLQGRAPYPAPGGAARVAYEVGGGGSGNVGRVAWSGVAGGAAIRARSPVAAVGGRDPETFDEARERVAADLARPGRAVTAADHVAIALATPGVAVARAYAAIGADPTCPDRRSPGIATVYVVPDVPARTADDVRAGRAIAAPRADRGLLGAVERSLARARLLGHIVHVATARYRAARVEVLIEVDPYDPAALRDRVAGAIRRHLDPLVGGDDQAGWPFGAPLMPSDLVRVAQESLDQSGDLGAVVQVQVAIDGGPLADPCDNVDLADHELAGVEDVSVRLRRPGAPAGQGGGA